MLPILISIGPFQIYALSVFIVFAWSVFSFLFWRSMREFAVTEEKTFDLMFYGTIAALIGSRIVFVASNWSVFVGSPLTILAIWIAPGLSLYGALITGIIVMMLVGRLRKVRIGMVLDALALALPAGLLVGKIGSLLGASEVGRVSNFPFFVYYAGYPEARHPVQLYEMIVLLILAIGNGFLARQSLRHHWAYGMVGIIFFGFYSSLSFFLEFLKESSLYWQGLTVNQWVLIGLFSQSIGALYIRGGGRIWTKKIIARLYARISKQRFI